MVNAAMFDVRGATCRFMHRCPSALRTFLGSFVQEFGNRPAMQRSFWPMASGSPQWSLAALTRRPQQVKFVEAIQAALHACQSA